MTKLIRSPSFIIPFALNQLGSLLYMSVVLPMLPLSIAMPVANVSASLFGWIASVWVTNRKYDSNEMVGVSLCVMGLYLASTTAAQ